MAPLAAILRLNTRLFRNCLEGVTDQQSLERLSTTTNNVAFVAAHVADSRFYLLKNLRDERISPLAAYLEGARSIDEIKRYPTLEETSAAWTLAAHALRDRFSTLTTAELDAPTTLRLIAGDQTVLGVVAFLVQHESYHIGQLALLRKGLGLSAMRYQ